MGDGEQEGCCDGHAQVIQMEFLYTPVCCLRNRIELWLRPTVKLLACSGSSYYITLETNSKRQTRLDAERGLFSSFESSPVSTHATSSILKPLGRYTSRTHWDTQAGNF